MLGKPKRRFTVEKALLMCYANMRREITLELVEQRIQDALDAREKASRGSRIWVPRERQ